MSVREAKSAHPSSSLSTHQELWMAGAPLWLSDFEMMMMMMMMMMVMMMMVMMMIIIIVMMMMMMP